MDRFLATELPRLRDAFAAEFFKVSRRRMTYICIAVFTFLVLLFYTVLWLRLRDGPGDTQGTFATWLTARSAMSFRNVVPYSFALERFFATLVCVVFAGTMMGNEYDWRTVGVVTSRGVRRWHFLFAKSVVCVGFTIITLFVGFLAAMATSAWFTNLYGLPWGTFDFFRAADAFLSLFRTTLVVLPFVFLALLFGTVWRSGGQAVGAAAGVFFIEQIFVGLMSQARGWVKDVPDFYFSVNIDAVMRANGTFARQEGGGLPFALTPGGPPEWRGALVLTAWMLAFAVLVFWRFQRRDIQE